MDRTPKWSKAEEKAIFNYVVANSDNKGKIDWSQIQLQFADKTIPQCTAKYYRMLNAGTWDFDRAIRRKKNEQQELINQVLEFLAKQ